MSVSDAPHLIMVDDAVAREWEPFALTRPIGELMFGVVTLRERAERALSASCIGHVSAPHLEGFDEPGAPPTLSPDSVAADRWRIFLLSRFVPALNHRWDDQPLAEGIIRAETGEVVGWISPPGRPAPSAEALLVPERLDGDLANTLPGQLLTYPWELVLENPERIILDVAALVPQPPCREVPPHVFHWGEHPLVIDPSARLEPGCALDTSKGPIWLDRDVQVRAFTRLAGPAYIGPGTIVLGGAIEAVSFGPMCRIRGEVAETVCLGYTNKQHDGHIGHAYLGRWVNLGAETTNSDLKNNYGSIRLWTPRGEVDTGSIKMGSLIGDHVKTGIGVLLNTGTVIGAGSNVYGTAMPPTYIPPFSWGTGSDLTEYRLDKFLEVAERVMGRRGVQLTESGRGQLERAWRHARERLASPVGDAPS